MASKLLRPSRSVVGPGGKEGTAPGAGPCGLGVLENKGLASKPDFQTQPEWGRPCGRPRVLAGPLPISKARWQVEARVGSPSYRVPRLVIGAACTHPSCMI